MPEDSTGVAHSSLPGSALRQTCFVDMPFGKKVDPKTGVTVDFDQVFHQGIRPAVEAAGLQCIRGDQEETGGLIHTAMFARLLLAEFVVADMTTANPNVFYELGVRHAARPYTTIPIFATIGAPPFDVNGVRAIPYELAEGKLTPEAAASLVESIKNRIQAALARTRVAVLLVSPDFLASDFIHEKELGPLLAAAEAGGVRILWVPLRPSAYEETSLKDLQAVSPPDKPLAQMSKADRDAAWVLVCKEIKGASQSHPR